MNGRCLGDFRSDDIKKKSEKILSNQKFNSFKQYRLINGFRVMFYIVSPWELNLDGTDPKPDYDTKYALPMFFVLIFLEWAVLEITRVLNPNAPKTGSYRLNDFIMSVALGACQATFQLLLTLVGLNLEIECTPWYTRTTESRRSIPRVMLFSHTSVFSSVRI